MINITDRPIVQVTGDELDARVRRAITKLYSALDAKYDISTWREHGRKTKDSLGAHSSTVVTAHYTVSTPELMAEKLAAVEREIQDSMSAAYIRADRPDGMLYRTFAEDRSRAIDVFQFAPAVALWSTEDLAAGPDGLDLLKSSPMSQICFRETHICPVGEACPTDILAKIGEPRRCGLCPLAMRCIDHLPAIAAKINQLLMRVRSNTKRAEQLSGKGEPASAVDGLYDAAEMDANEIVGWQLSHDILLKMYEVRGAEAAEQYHVESPEIVQRHLKVVTANRSISEFLLQRVADANAYPTLADPEIQRIADRFCRYVLAGKQMPVLDDDPVATLVGLVRTQLAPMGLTTAKLAEYIDEYEAATKAGQPLLGREPTLLLANEEEVTADE